MELSIDLAKRNASMKWFFDWKAEGFDDVHLALMESKTAITKALPETGIHRVLDLGVGTGLELFALVEKYPDVQVVGVDISPNMLSYIEKRPFASQVECVIGDFFTVDFGESYDAVISSSALHHFAPEDKARLYVKTAKALRPGGWFVNADEFVDTVEEMEEYYRFYVEHTEKPHCDTPLTVAMETELLEKAGFSDIRFYPFPEDKKYKLLVCRIPE